MHITGDVSHEYRNGCARTNAQPTARSRATAIFTQAAGAAPGPQARAAGRAPDGRRVAPDRGAQHDPRSRRLLSTVTIVASPSGLATIVCLSSRRPGQARRLRRGDEQVAVEAEEVVTAQAGQVVGPRGHLVRGH